MQPRGCLLNDMQPHGCMSTLMCPIGNPESTPMGLQQMAHCMLYVRRPSSDPTTGEPFHAEDAMSRSLSFPRRGLLGIAFVCSLGFGATQAFAGPEQSRQTCTATGYDYATPECGAGCYRNIGYCDYRGYCRCGQVP
jgi:hypothetical protein